MKKQGWSKMIPKYRGLSIDEDSKGKWKYGYLIEDNEQSFIINEVVEANEQYITIGSWYPVRPDTTSQSTGLHDKDGKEIFEGDIVTDGDVISNIKYHQTLGFYMINKYGFGIPFGQGVDVEYFEDFAVHVSKTFEVIGNIYENPKLLEVTK